ncbi:MAG: DUF3307 domain-containing protein [Bdellovibrionales bacterium]|jgi:hypothetical protein|nr:DUF3307 domain-containing protein [Bdellovibrionales bacterium]
MAAEESLKMVFVLLFVFQLKHFIADFPLQNRYMLQKTRSDWSFIIPLAYHCAIHAIITLMICLAVQPQLWWLAVVDFVVHFTMDRIKAGPRYLGRYRDTSKTGFWVAFGIDQMVHHFTHYWIIWMLVVGQYRL